MPEAANPFAAAPVGRTTPPTRPQGSLIRRPENALLRRYLIDAPDAPAGLAAALPAPDPFVAVSPAPPPMDAKLVASWTQPWEAVWPDNAWNSLSTAWAHDAVSVRKQFRKATGSDWPVDVAEDTARLAVMNWLRSLWQTSAQGELDALRSKAGVRGPIIVRAPFDAALALPASALNHPSPLFTPRVTGDPWTNRYGVGFVVRLTADLTQRIPFPVFNLSKLTDADAGWIQTWTDEVVRQGVAGIGWTVGQNARSGNAMTTAVAPLRTANVYLPPPSEAGILVSTDTCALEPGAWIALFRTYAALRSAGVWPDFVSDTQITDGSVSPARLRILVVPAAHWINQPAFDALAGWVRRGGTLVVTDPEAFKLNPRGHAVLRRDSLTNKSGARVIARSHDGADLLRQKHLGDGWVILAGDPLDAEDGTWNAFWAGAARDAGVESIPWRETVTTANVAVVTTP